MSDLQEDVKEYIKPERIKFTDALLHKCFKLKSIFNEASKPGPDLYDRLLIFPSGKKVKLEVKEKNIRNNWEDIYGGMQSYEVSIEKYIDAPTKFSPYDNGINSKYTLFIFRKERFEKDVNKCTAFLLCKTEPLQKWWVNNCENYKEKINEPTMQGIYEKHTSSYCWVPIKDLPKESICLFIKDRPSETKEEKNRYCGCKKVCIEDMSMEEIGEEIKRYKTLKIK